MGKRRKRVVKVPAHDYEPTKAEMEQPVNVEAGDITFEDAVQRFLPTPVEVRDEWRARRKSGNQ